MGYPLENEGVLSVVMERFEKRRLPRIMDIKEMVDNGGKLSKSDIMFLGKVFYDTKQYAHYASTHEEFKSLFCKVTSLYDEISKKALDNESAANGLSEKYSD